MARTLVVTSMYKNMSNVIMNDRYSRYINRHSRYIDRYSTYMKYIWDLPDRNGFIKEDIWKQQ